MLLRKLSTNSLLTLPWLVLTLLPLPNVRLLPLQMLKVALSLPSKPSDSPASKEESLPGGTVNRVPLLMSLSLLNLLLLLQLLLLLPLPLLGVRLPTATM